MTHFNTITGVERIFKVLLFLTTRVRSLNPASEFVLPFARVITYIYYIYKTRYIKENILSSSSCSKHLKLLHTVFRFFFTYRSGGSTTSLWISHLPTDYFHTIGIWHRKSLQRLVGGTKRADWFGLDENIFHYWPCPSFRFMWNGGSRQSFYSNIHCRKRFYRQILTENVKLHFFRRSCILLLFVHYSKWTCQLPWHGYHRERIESVW